MNEWKITGARVYGYGRSYNCTNKITAEQLYNTLTEYEKTIQLTENTNQKLDKIQKQVIQIETTLKTLDKDIKKLKEVINNDTNNR